VPSEERGARGRGVDVKNANRAEHLKWLKANGHDLGPLTGTDHRALAAIAACWDLYSVCREPCVLDAVTSLTDLMQEKTKPLARELIAWAMDWDDRERLWPMNERRQS
jgi:hypothetical protein